VIPVDVASNALIAIAWKRQTIKNNELYISNVTTVGEFPS
jgi:hypothetical protein